jgi:hypothetical protein
MTFLPKQKPSPSSSNDIATARRAAGKGTAKTTTQAFGDTAAAGASGSAARVDHRMPAAVTCDTIVDGSSYHVVTTAEKAQIDTLTARHVLYSSAGGLTYTQGSSNEILVASVSGVALYPRWFTIWLSGGTAWTGGTNTYIHFYDSSTNAIVASIPVSLFTGNAIITPQSAGVILFPKFSGAYALTAGANLDWAPSINSTTLTNGTSFTAGSTVYYCIDYFI